MDVMNSASLPFSTEEARRVSRVDEVENFAAHTSPPVAILGVPLENPTNTTAISRLDAAIRRGRSYLAVSVDLATIAAMRRVPELRRLLAENDLGLCNSLLVCAAARLAGRAISRRIDPAEFRAQLLQLTATRGYRIYFLGADAAAVIALQQEFPSLKIAGFDSEMEGPAVSPDLVRRIRESHAQLVLVSPCGDRCATWLATHHRRLNVPVCVVGITVSSRETSRLQTAGGADRPVTVPRKYGRLRRSITTAIRQLHNVWTFCADFVNEAHRWSRSKGEPTPGPLVTSAAHDWLHIDAGGELTRGAIEMHAEVWRLFAHRTTHWALDVSRVRRIDATGVAFLLRGRTALQACDHQLVLVGATAPVRTALTSAQVDTLFTFAASEHEAHRAVAAQRAPPAVEVGRTRSLAWCGEIVAANVEDVWQMTMGYARTFACAGACLVIIDLERLRFIDSAGAGLMLRVKKWARELHVEVLFAHPPMNVRQMLQLTRIDRLLLEGAQ